jgi:hypothetical protein
MKRIPVIAWLACLAVGASPLFASQNRGYHVWDAAQAAQLGSEASQIGDMLGC